MLRPSPRRPDGPTLLPVGRGWWVVLALGTAAVAGCGGSKRQPPNGSGGVVVFHRIAISTGNRGFGASARRDRIIVFQTLGNTADLARAKAANRKVVALAYVDPFRLHPANWGNTCMTDAEAASHGWDSGVVGAYGGHVPRLDAPGYAEACLKEILARLAASRPRWDGVLLDDVNCACDPRGSPEQSYAGADGARWRAAEDHLDAVLSAGLHRAGYLVFANMGAWGAQDLGSGGWETTQLRWFDGAEDEYFLNWGDGTPQDTPTALAGIAALRSSQQQGKWFLADTPTTDPARVRLALALVLLYTRGKASLYAPTPATLTQADRSWSVYGDAARLGRPLGPARGLTRRFEHGTVRVDPGAQTGEIRVEG